MIFYFLNFVLTCVVASGKVVSSIFFAANELLRVKQLTVGASPHFIDYSWFKVQKHGAWHVLSGAGLTEECVESIISASDCFVT